MRVELPRAFQELLTAKNRYKVFYGGRAGGKSFAFADALLTKATSKKLLIACVREVQSSIKDSVHKLICDRILFYGLKEYKIYEDIIQEMQLVYLHDNRPWMIGFSGGKDSTLLCCLVMEMLKRLPADKRNKTVYIVSSDTLVENPIVRDYMHKMSAMINEVGSELNVKADIIYPKIEDTFWCKIIL